MTFNEFTQLQKGEVIIYQQQEFVVVNTYPESIEVMIRGEARLYEFKKTQARYISKTQESIKPPSVVVKTLQGNIFEYSLNSDDFDITVMHKSNSHGWIQEIRAEINLKKLRKPRQNNFYANGGYIAQTVGAVMPPPPGEPDYTKFVVIFPTLEHFKLFMESLVTLGNHIVESDPRLKSQKYFGELLSEINKNLFKNP